MPMSIYGEPSSGTKTVTKTVTKTQAQPQTQTQVRPQAQIQQPQQADIQLLNDFVTRNTNILTQLQEQMNKSKAEQRLTLLKEEIELKMATLTRSAGR